MMGRPRGKSKRAKEVDDVPHKKPHCTISKSDRQNEALMSKEALIKKYFNDTVPEKEVRTLLPHDLAEEYLTFLGQCNTGRQGSAEKCGQEELSEESSPEKQNKQKEHSLGEHKENVPMQQTDDENEESDDKSTNDTNKRSRRRRNNPTKNLLKCLVCDTIFKTKSEKQAHYEDHLGRRGYECTYCTKAFDKMPSLVSHVSRVHLINKKLSCKVCGQVFKRDCLLRSHSLTHTSKRRFSCPVCKRGFIRKRDLFDHISGHVDYNPYKCDECGRRFQMSCYLSLHRKIHVAVRPFKCKFCDVLCLSYSDVEMHTLMHAEGLGKNCDDCNMRIPSNKHTLHTISHNREKTFKCTLCPVKFHAKSTLADHIKAHKLIKEYKCDVCDKVMQTVSECSDHICPKWTKQKAKDIHLCTICDVYMRTCDIKEHNEEHVPRKSSTSREEPLELDLKEFSEENEGLWTGIKDILMNNVSNNCRMSDGQEDSDDSSLSDDSSFSSVDGDDRSSLLELKRSSSSVVLKNPTFEHCSEPLNLDGGLFQGTGLVKSDIEEEDDSE